MQIDSYLFASIKLKSKWINDLNRNPDTPSLIEEQVWNDLAQETNSWTQNQ